MVEHIWNKSVKMEWHGNHERRIKYALQSFCKRMAWIKGVNGENKKLKTMKKFTSIY